MIISFKSKKLEKFYLKGITKGITKGINADHIRKLKRVLARLNAATEINDMNAPGYRLHPYKGMADVWSVDVSGNYRVLFEFKNGDAYIVDYLDPH